MGVLTALLFCGFTSTGAYIPEPYQSAIHLPDGKMPSFAPMPKTMPPGSAAKAFQELGGIRYCYRRSTYMEQLDNKIAYIEQLYQSKQELFIIEDGITGKKCSIPMASNTV